MEGENMKVKSIPNILLSIVFFVLSYIMFKSFSDLNGITVIDGNGTRIKILNLEIAKSVPSNTIYIYKAVFFVLSFIFICSAAYNVYRAVKIK